MTTSTVTRQTFDEVMVPVFSPRRSCRTVQRARVWDTAGREYIDFACGIAVTSLGHGHPELLKVLDEQGRKLWHIGNGYTNEPVLRLAKRLESLTFADRAFFANSGAEANEAALKLARRVAFDRHGADKAEIISFVQSFHGRTFFTVSVGGQPVLGRLRPRAGRHQAPAVQRHRSREGRDRPANLRRDRRGPCKAKAA